MELLIKGAQSKHDTGAISLVVYLDLPVVIVAVPWKRLGSSYGGRTLAALRMEANLELILANYTLWGSMRQVELAGSMRRGYGSRASKTYLVRFIGLIPVPVVDP